MSTNIQGTYVAPTCTNLTQSVSRAGSLTQAVTPMVLTTGLNYSKTYTATFAISSANPSTISFAPSAGTGNIVATRASNTFTVSSSYTAATGVTVNNWAHFQAWMQSMQVVTDNTVWPNPAFTIATSVTDGTTTLTGTISVGQLDATVPSTPGIPTYVRNWNTNIVVNWAAAVQAFGPGIGGYYIYRNGTGSVYATVTGTGTTYTDTSVTNTGSYSYQIQAYDLSGTPILSAISSASTAPIAVNPTTPGVPTTTRNWNTNVVINWAGSTQSVGPGVAGYYIYRNGTGSVYATVTGAGTLTYTDTSVTNTGSYTYQIQAYDGTTVPLVSTISSGTTAPIATTPTAPVLSINKTSRTSAILTWTAGTQSVGPGVQGYRVYRNSVLFATITSGLTTTDSSLVIDTQYDYHVNTIDFTTVPLVSADSNTQSVTPVFITNYSTTAVQTSPDTVTWTSRTLPATSNWTGATPGTQTIVIVTASANTSAAYTYDAITWTAATMPSNGPYTTPVYGSSTYVSTKTASTTAFAYSTNGTTWSAGTFPTSGAWTVVYGGGQWVAFQANVSTNVCMSSTDGINWTNRTFPTTQTWFDVAYGGGTFVATNTASTTTHAYSTNGGVSWTTMTAPVLNGYSAWNGSEWRMCTNLTGATAASSSTDGITWTSAVAMPASGLWGRPVYASPLSLWYNGQLVSGTAGGRVTGGNTVSNWTTTSGGTGGQPAYLNGKLVVPGLAASNSVSVSTNGTTWVSNSTLAGSGPVTITFG